MFLLNLPINIEEQAAIERRRRAEAERVSRIFNEKFRTIGIDRTSLDEQVKERQRMKDLEKQRENAFHRHMIENDMKSLLIEDQQSFQQCQEAQTLNLYRQLYQKAEDSREWDLNNHQQWKLETPARIHDDDPRLGPSSGQIFAGEDLQASTRKRLQQEQMKTYFQLQTEAKRRQNEHESLANLLYDEKERRLNEKSSTFEEMENECRRAIDLATRNYNESLIREKTIRTNELRRRETEEQLAELANSCFSDLLTENTHQHSSIVCQRHQHRHPIFLDRWKGMTKDQLNEIHQQQWMQMSQCQKTKLDEKHLDDLWQQYANAQAKQSSLIEEQIEAEHRHLSHQFAHDNRTLAKIQKDHQNYLNSTVYRSIPTAAFYQQFNTTSR